MSQTRQKRLIAALAAAAGNPACRVRLGRRPSPLEFEAPFGRATQGLSRTCPIKSLAGDPVYRLMSKNRDAAEMRAGGGVKVEFAFSMGTAQIVCATQEAHEARALGQIRA